MHVQPDDQPRYEVSIRLSGEHEQRFQFARAASARDFAQASRRDGYQVRIECLEGESLWVWSENPNAPGPRCRRIEALAGPFDIDEAEEARETLEAQRRGHHAGARLMRFVLVDGDDAPPADALPSYRVAHPDAHVR